jgi:hypothetical protein
VDVRTGERAASSRPIFFGLPPRPPQCGIARAAAPTWIASAILRVEGTTRLIVALFRKRPPRAVLTIRSVLNVRKLGKVLG